MAVSLKDSAHSAPALSSDLFAGLGTRIAQGAAQTGKGVWRRIAAAYYVMQLSRVQKCLHEMNDRQLAQIGVARSDISRYAEGLMGDKPATK